MEIKNVQKRERKSVVMSIRITKKVSAWMKEKNVSPTAVFNEAIKDLIKKK